MKKLLILFMVAFLCLGMFVACGEDEPPVTSTVTLDDAVEYLNSTYKTDEGKKTPANYKLMAQIPIDGVTFEVTWTVDLNTITIVLENGLYTVQVPAKNETEVTYKLTATVKDADGNQVQKEFTRILPVYDNSASVDELAENEAYKLYMVQANLGLTVFATHETQTGKFIKTTLDPKAAPDFFAEKVDGGYKFYTTIDGVKNYVHCYTTTDPETEKVSKYICYATESDCVYTYKADVKAWFVKINNIDYVVGTYGDYETICISESTYITAENTGVSQFPVSFMKKADAEALVPSERPADPTEEITIPAFTEIANAQPDKGAATAEKYIVSGVITEIANTQYGNLYIEDASGNKLYVYGLYSADGSVRFDEMTTQPKVGDTITVLGVACNYNGPQMKNGWMTKLVPGEGGGEEDDEPSTPTNETTIPAFNEIASAQPDKGDATTEKYLVSGVVTEIKNTQYGNLYIEDASGNKLYIYGLYSADGSTRFDAMTTQPKVGDTITVLGVACNYNGPQMKNGWMTKLVPGEGSGEEDDEPSTPTGETTIPAFNEIASAQPDKGDATTEKYLVSGVITEIKNTQYGNLYIEDASGNKLYIYGLYSADGSTRFDAMTTQPKVGDTITVLGVACNYNGPQMKNGWMTKLVPGEGGDSTDTPAETPDLPEADATLSFATLDNRTSYSDAQQVWSANGITVTNDQAASTSKVGNYSDPARFYKSTSILIECTGMKTIVFDVNTKDKTIDGVVDSLVDCGGTVTTSGNYVIVEFATAVNSLSIESVAAQFRLNGISITK